MEFPHLGEHCSLKSCNQLDFLPFKCNACSQIYCKDHFFYDKHQCEKSALFDHQVPVCPLCDKPIPYKHNELPDINMNKHIEEECFDERAKQKRKNKIYKNKCFVANCKEKELIELICEFCGKNFCLKHRHTTDHQCSEKNNINKKSNASSMASAAALKRMKDNSLKSLNPSSVLQRINNYIQAPSNNSSNNVQTVQGNLNEDEALAKAIELSLNQNTNTISDEDADLARAIELSKKDLEKNKDKCCIN